MNEFLPKKKKELSNDLCVEEEHVALYVKHLEELKTVASIRENERKKKRETKSNKKYEEYDWPLLIQSGTLQTLKVKELDKYLTKHSLPTVGIKDDKVKRITAAWLLYS